MIIKLVLIISLMQTAKSDTLLYPIKGGQVDTSLKTVGMHEVLGLDIFATNHPEVYSCSKGVVMAAVNYEEENRKIILIANDNLFFVYVLDSIDVRKGEEVQIGQKIGKLNRRKENNGKDSLPLYFIVFRLDKNQEDTKKYLWFY